MRRPPRRRPPLVVAFVARAIVAVTVVVMACMRAPEASAQPAQAPKSAPAARPDRASELSTAAGRAAAVGEYGFAIQAFKQAYALSQSDAHLFAIAEAHRKRYALEKKHYDLLQSSAFYRRYLELAPTGEHRAAAERAVAELTPQVEGAASDPGELAAAADQESAATRLAVTSTALGAVVKIDGGLPRNLPLFVELTPGKHKLAVTAPGYFDEQREIVVGKGSAYVEAFALDPKPSKLCIDAPSGAEVRIDGVAVGEAPLADALDLEPGKHFIAVTLIGHEPEGKLVTFERGKVKKISVELEDTDQRTAAWVLIGSAGPVLATGIAFGVMSVIEHRLSRDILQGSDEDEELSDADQLAFDDAITARDNYRIVSGVAGGTGLGLFLLGGLLYAFDEPDAPTAAAPTSSSRAPTISAFPVIGPGIVGATTTLRF